MAGPAPKTEGWTARENKHKPKGLHLIVGGMVEVSATNKMPILSEGAPAGKTLPLDLIVTECGLGGPIVVWREASYHKVVSANEFDKVEIRWGGKAIASCPVIDDKEQGQSLAEEMENVHAAGEKLQAPEPSASLVKKRAAAKEAAEKRAAALKAEKAAAAKHPVLKLAPQKKSAKKTTKKKSKTVGGWAKSKKKTAKARRR